MLQLAVVCTRLGVREERWRLESGRSGGGRDVQCCAAGHRSRLYHGLRRHRGWNRGDAPSRRVQTLRAASCRWYAGPSTCGRSRFTRGATRGRDADDGLREPDVQVLRVVDRRQRMRVAGRSERHRLNVVDWIQLQPDRACVRACV